MCSECGQAVSVEHAEKELAALRAQVNAKSEAVQRLQGLVADCRKWMDVDEGTRAQAWGAYQAALAAMPA